MSSARCVSPVLTAERVRARSMIDYNNNNTYTVWLARIYVYVCPTAEPIPTTTPRDRGATIYALCTTTSEAVRVRLVGFECVCVNDYVCVL